jgi:hypothetical protein
VKSQPPPNALAAFLPELLRKETVLGEAMKHVKDASSLVRAFEETTAAFVAYDNMAPLHTRPTTLPPRPWPPIVAHDVAAWLATKRSVSVEGALPRSLRYLDREITAYAGHAKKDALRADLLFGDESDRTPVLCEMKFKADANPAYAVVQLLATATPFLGPLQRTRLQLWGSGPDFVLSNSRRLDLLVLLVDPPQDEDAVPVREAATQLSEKLRDARSIARHIRHFDVVSVSTCTQGLVAA